MSENDRSETGNFQENQEADKNAQRTKGIKLKSFR